MITQSEATAPGEMVLHKLQAVISVFSGATGETSSGLIGGTIASVTPENSFQKTKKKKSLAMSPPRKNPIQIRIQNLGLKNINTIYQTNLHFVMELNH